MSVPAVVTLDLWGVPAHRVPGALARMAGHRRPLRRTPGLTFAKLLGTGSAETFTLRDADPGHWGLLAAWDDEQAAADFAAGPLCRSWHRISHEHLRLRLQPLRSRGHWAGRTPFGDPGGQQPSTSSDGPVAAITRARLRLSTARSFWAAVPPVSADLTATDGLLLALGIGEAPVGLQGTVSLWRDQDCLTGFAHRTASHREVMARTVPERWYSEELFARFRVLECTGRYRGAGVPLP